MHSSRMRTVRSLPNGVATSQDFCLSYKKVTVRVINGTERFFYTAKIDLGTKLRKTLNNKLKQMPFVMKFWTD